MEIFKDIKGFEGLYQISTLGNVKSTPSDGKKERILKQESTKSKNIIYKRVSLSKNGEVIRFLVHRLVCEAFIPNPFNKPQVNHIDNNTNDNNVTNLEWCKAKENMAHSSRQGRQNGLQEKATIAASKVNIKKAVDKYDKLVGKDLNGRTLLKYFKDSNNRFKGMFQCKSCNNVFEAGLDESLRKSKRGTPIYCRSCMAKARGKDIV